MYRLDIVFDELPGEAQGEEKIIFSRYFIDIFIQCNEDYFYLPYVRFAYTEPVKTILRYILFCEKLFILCYLFEFPDLFYLIKKIIDKSLCQNILRLLLSKSS